MTERQFTYKVETIYLAAESFQTALNDFDEHGWEILQVSASDGRSKLDSTGHYTFILRRPYEHEWNPDF